MGIATTAGATSESSGTAAAPDEALRIALLSPEAASEAARGHYETTSYRGLWLRPGGDDRAAIALVAALEGAPAHGLPEGRYHVDVLRAALAAAAGGDAEATAAAELALTRAYLRYARDLTSGLLEPQRIDRDLDFAPIRPEPAALLARMAGPDPAAALAALAPSDPGYAGLTAELARLRALPSGVWGPTVSEGESIKPGERGPRVAAVRARLTMLGALEAPVMATATTTAGGAVTTPDPALFDGALEAAVRAFQRENGLNDDGVIGQRTIEAMNASPEDRIGQILVNLERMRWKNYDRGRRHVYVNQADFTVTLMDNGVPLFQERVVVGSRRHRTPEFSDAINHLVFNPTWHVPRSIAGKEILPLLKEDPDYLAKKNMRLVSRYADETPPDPATTDWSSYSARDFPYAIKQAPGDGNALGRVKFMFPNHHSIYLHDTPQKKLFAKDARAFSHGCIRVQDPMRLAYLLLAAQEADPQARIDRLLAAGREAVVRLETPVPVHLDYRTAWIGAAGEVEYRADVYGRDGRVLEALRGAGVEIEAGVGG